MAMLELKVALANLLRKFRFELASEVKAEWYLTYKPADVYLRVLMNEL